MTEFQWVMTICTLAIVLIGSTGCAGAGRSSSVKAADYREAVVGPDRLTIAELQSEVMSFSDTYTSFIGQATVELIAKADSPQQRLAANDVRLRSVSGALTVASNPNPAVGLLDMIVLVRLEHDVADSSVRGSQKSYRHSSPADSTKRDHDRRIHIKGDGCRA